MIKIKTKTHTMEMELIIVVAKILKKERDINKLINCLILLILLILILVAILKMASIYVNSLHKMKYMIRINTTRKTNTQINQNTRVSKQRQKLNLSLE